MEQRTRVQDAIPSNTDHTVFTSMCGVCPAGCGVNVHLVDGKIERLTPLKGHPLGIVCPRGMQAKEIVYAEDRLLYPQRRIGSRGEGAFERISWDEAYTVIVDELRRIAGQFGPEAACVYTGRGNFEFSLNEFSGCGWTMKNIRLDYQPEEDSDDVMTEYEEKFRGLGQPIYRLEAFMPLSEEK